MHELSALPEIGDFEVGDTVRLCGPHPTLAGQWARITRIGSGRRPRLHVVLVDSGRRACVAPAWAWPA